MSENERQAKALVRLVHSYERGEISAEDLVRMTMKGEWQK